MEGTKIVLICGGKLSSRGHGLRPGRKRRPAPPALALRLDPPHDMGRESLFRDLFFTNCRTPDRNPGLMDRLGAFGDQRMPPEKITALANETIGTAFWQPGKPTQLMRREFDAIGDAAVPIGVIGAAAGPKIKKLAGEPRDGDVATVFIFELDEAALGAAVAKRFPFLRRHLFKRLGLPELFSPLIGAGDVQGTMRNPSPF